jgi:hypothetical protein
MWVGASFKLSPDGRAAVCDIRSLVCPMRDVARAVARRELDGRPFGVRYEPPQVQRFLGVAYCPDDVAPACRGRGGAVRLTVDGGAMHDFAATCEDTLGLRLLMRLTGDRPLPDGAKIWRTEMMGGLGFSALRLRSLGRLPVALEGPPELQGTAIRLCFDDVLDPSSPSPLPPPFNPPLPAAPHAALAGDA